MRNLATDAASAIVRAVSAGCLVDFREVLALVVVLAVVGGGGADDDDDDDDGLFLSSERDVVFSTADPPFSTPSTSTPVPGPTSVVTVVAVAVAACSYEKVWLWWKIREARVSG